MTICVTGGAPTFVQRDTCVRVMRWTFRRDHETVVCELGLNDDRSAYEIRIAPPGHSVKGGTELFDDAMAAFQRHTAIERQLVGEGWSLESFESERVPR
jgi:hypothetical protein